MPTIVESYAALDFMYNLAVRAGRKQVDDLQGVDDQGVREKLRQAYYSNLAVADTLRTAFETIQKEALSEFIAGGAEITPEMVIETVYEASNGQVTLAPEAASLLIEAAQAWGKENNAAQ